MADPGSWLRDARQYLNEVQAEGKKITWPAQKEAVAGAIGVIVICTIFALFLAVVDFGLGMLVRTVLG
jgi:preprotein translocase subunit SecE